MAGDRRRDVSSLYQRPRTAEEEVEGSDRRRRRTAGRRRGPSPPTPREDVLEEEEEEEEVAPVDELAEELVPQTGEEEGAHEDDEEVVGTGSASSSSSLSVYLRGPASLPQVLHPDRRPVIRPEGQKNWVVVSGGSARSANGILGLLCRQHYPGIVTYAGKTEPAYSFDHYAVGPDAEYPNKAARVKAEFWTYFRCDEGFEARADQVATKACKKLITDMHHEVRIQAIVTYHGSKLGEKVTKKDARNMTLTRDQYLEMIPWWCQSYPECWAMIVDKWFTEEYLQMHSDARDRRLMMQGPAHHQGSRSLSAYKQAWSASHSGQPCSDFQAWCMAHKGKATSDVSFNLEDPPQAYTNPSVHTRISEYTSAARSAHGPEHDPSTQDIDGEIVMRVGQGKKHGRFWLGDSLIDTASTPSLSQIRARSTSESPAIRPRQTAAQHRVDALEARLEQEMRQRQELEAEQQRMSAQLEAEQAERQAQTQRLADITEFLQGLGQHTGFAVPAGLLAPPPPPRPAAAATPPQSAGSNNPPHAPPNDGAFPSPQSQWPPSR